MRKLVLGITVALAGSVWADTCYWCGNGANTYWATPENWVDGKIPGRYLDQTTGDEVGSYGDVAVFDGANLVGAKKTIIDLASLKSVFGVRIQGVDSPTFQFGNTSNKSLTLDPTDGSYFEVAEGVTNMPSFRNGNFLKLGSAYDSAKDLYPVFYVINNGSGVLNMPEFRPGDRAAGMTKYVYPCVYFQGTSDICLTAQERNNLARFYPDFTGDAKLVVGCDLVAGVSGQLAPARIIAGTHSPTSIVQIAEDKHLVLRRSASRYEVKKGDLKFIGPGSVGLGFDTDAKNQAHMEIWGGQTLEFACPVYVYTEDPKCASADMKRIILDALSAGGTVKFTSSNAATGAIMLASPGTLEATAIGAPGVANELGSGDSVCLSAEGVLKYVGAGAETTRTICLTNVMTYDSGERIPRGTLQNDSAGTWTVKDVVFAGTHAEDGLLGLSGSGANGVIDCALADNVQDATKTLSVTKSGTGTWTLMGDNTFSGTLTIEEGVLKVAESSCVAMSQGVVLTGTGTLVFEGGETADSAAVMAVHVAGGTPTLKVTGNRTLVVGALARDDGTLKVELEGNGVLTVSDMALHGTTPAWLKVNGRAARIGASGEVTPADASVLVAARGDVIPNVGDAQDVFIFKAGTTGNDTVAAAETRLKDLYQVSTTPSTIEVGEGNSLVINGRIQIDEGRASLTVGAPGDKGKLASSKVVWRLANANPASVLRFNLWPPDSSCGFIVEETGPVVFSGKDMVTQGYDCSLGTQAGKCPTLRIEGGLFKLSAKPLMVGKADNEQTANPAIRGKLVVTNGLFVNAVDAAGTSRSYTQTGNRALKVGHGGVGVMEVLEGAVVSNKLVVGGGSATDEHFALGSGYGSVRQRDGEMAVLGSRVMPERSSSVGQGGADAMGHYELSGGRFIASGMFSVGNFTTGLFHQYGGASVFRAVYDYEPKYQVFYVGASTNGTGYVYVGGGSMIVSNTLSLAGASGQNPSMAVVSVDGVGTTLDVPNMPIALNDNAADATSSRIDVAHGAVFKTQGVYEQSSADGAKSVVTFDNGNVVKRVADSVRDLFAFHGAARAVDSVVVYDGGMTVDTETDERVQLSASIEGATGKGVAAIPVDFGPLAVYDTLPPAVEIAGDGEDATAHCLFDSALGAVTNVVITCRGRNYTWAKARFYRGARDGGTTIATVDCELSDNLNVGSFTKSGVGTLELSGANAWGGDTVLAGGTLKLMADGAIPSSTRFVLKGGVLDANGFTVPKALAVDAADVLSGTPMHYAGTLSCEDGTLAIRNLDVSRFNKETVYTLVTADEIVGTPRLLGFDDPDWRIVKRGNRLELKGQKAGLCIIVR